MFSLSPNQLEKLVIAPGVAFPESSLFSLPAGMYSNVHVALAALGSYTNCGALRVHVPALFTPSFAATSPVIAPWQGN